MFESGPIEEMTVGGLSVGASRFPQAIVDQPAQCHATRDVTRGMLLASMALSGKTTIREGFPTEESSDGDKVAG